jgi:hypothetical protein
VTNFYTHGMYIAIDPRGLRGKTPVAQMNGAPG